MRRVLAYVRCRTAIVAGRLRSSPWRYLGQAAFAAAALSAIWYGGSEMAELLEELALDPAVVVGGLVLVHVGVTAVASALVLGSTLLDARHFEEEEALRVLPIGALERFAFRVVDLAPAGLLTLVIVAPGLRFAAHGYGLTGGGEAALVAAFAIQAFGVACATLAALVTCVRWAPRALVRWRGVAAAIAAGLAVVAWIGVGRPRAELGAWGPPAWTIELARALAAGDRRTASRALASTLSFAALLGVIAERVHTWGVVEGWGRFRARFEVGHGRPGSVGRELGSDGAVAARGAARPRHAGSAPPWAISASARVVAALVVLEWRAVVRDRAPPVLAAGATVIVGVVAAAIAMAGGEHAAMLWIALWWGVGLLGANALALAALASIAREGQGLGGLAWMPVSERTVVDVRAAAYGAAIGAWGAGWAAAWWGAADVAGPWIWGATVVAVAMGYGGVLAALAVALGAICGRPGQGLHRGVSLAGLAAYAMLQGLLIATAVGVCLALAHVGSTGLVALGVGAAIWGSVVYVLRREAIAQLRGARRGSRSPF